MRVNFDSVPGRTLVTGGSGFIGSAIIKASTSNIRALVHKEAVEGNNIDRVYGDFLSGENQFEKWIDGVNSIIHTARPSSGNTAGRYRIARRTRKANISMVSAVKEAKIPSTILMHGSLSYGHRGEELVQTDSILNPVGYAEAYSIGERPWVDYLYSGGGVKVVRAPWVLGPGSWFEMLYCEEKIPVFGDGSQWMSLVSVESLADFTWSVLSDEPGVYHPQLLYRCRQSDFAKIVSEIRGVGTSVVSRSRLTRKYGKMATDSICSSMRLDDGNGMSSESDSSQEKLVNYLASMLGFSNT
ncbi:MAG: NAD-dependent epimerase/dehydratase family protein [Candidatus Thalassarchaeum sp.]|nr:NAD-dependent epimerase/dehydratase family protein [Candidatus Thalassarchaeum sp.]